MVHRLVVGFIFKVFFVQALNVKKLCIFVQNVMEEWIDKTFTLVTRKHRAHRSDNHEQVHPHARILVEVGEHCHRQDAPNELVDW